MTHTPLQTLDEVRTAIDALDGELIALLAKRQALVEQAGRLKPKNNAAAAPTLSVLPKSLLTDSIGQAKQDCRLMWQQRYGRV